jgi:putative flippase GtrA
MMHVARRIPVTFWRFALVGVCGLITDATLLEAGVAVGLSTSVARCFSVLLALQVTYALHLHFTFRTPELRSLVHRIRFMVANLIGSAVNYMVFVVIVFAQPISDPRLLRLGALLLATSVSLLVNYAINRNYVFGKSSS